MAPHPVPVGSLPQAPIEKISLWNREFLSCRQVTVCYHYQIAAADAQTLRQCTGAVVRFVLDFTEGIVFEWKQLQLCVVVMMMTLRFSIWQISVYCNVMHLFRKQFPDW